MNKQIRTIAKRIIPKPFLVYAWANYSRYKSKKIEPTFYQAPQTPAWLGWDELDQLQSSYPLREWTYHYDTETLYKRGQERMREMLRLVPKSQKQPNKFLDLGSWDGMTCFALQKIGKSCVGIDIRVEGIENAARKSGAEFSQMDAGQIGFPDNSFDFVFSYNSFEHFPNPEQVLLEAMRVVRPGGYIYLNFGPLYYSAWGAHQFRTISVPYCECLFTNELLEAYAAANDITLTSFHWMNEWTLTQYRNLWQKYAHRLETVAYYEIYNADHVDLIACYPSCFRSKTDNFDDLIVSNIELLFRKID